MIIRADARHIPLSDKSVQCVITSPPYWRLRDYGVEGQIGLEASLDEYIATIVAVMREVRRVLKDDGTLWLNLGDSYAGSGKGGQSEKKRSVNWQARYGNHGVVPIGLKPKDLCGIPWRLAFALQADGWYLRSDIVWAKPNPMPESVTDRPTRSHEYLFLLSKQGSYYYDADAIREPLETIERQGARRSYPPSTASSYGNGGHIEMRGPFAGLPLNPAGRNKRDVWTADDWDSAIQTLTEGDRVELLLWLRGEIDHLPKRDVWTISPEPTPEAHFATFPSKLVELCILAGSRIGDVVFDPFLGSGTVGKVVERLGRRWVGTELSAEYIEIAKRRTQQIGLRIERAYHRQG